MGISRARGRGAARPGRISGGFSTDAAGVNWGRVSRWGGETCLFVGVGGVSAGILDSSLWSE